MLLIAARRLGVAARLGYGSLLEYVERTLGHQAKVARERLRVAEALGDLPVTAAALRDGTLSWSAARELTRVAVADTEEEWLAAVAGRTVREVEQRVAGYLPGDRPSDQADDGARRHVLRLEISGATLALFREAQARLVKDSGGGLDDDAVMQSMCRQVLGGPVDAGRASYQIATFVCERCERGWQGGRGERVAVEPTAVEQARCDGQVVAGARATQDVTPATRRQVMLRDGGKCVVPGCRQATWVDVHHLTWREDGGGHDASNLAVTCSVHHAAIHEGRLLVDREATGLVFRHGDGTIYGEKVGAVAAETASEAFVALKAMGFKADEARRAVAAIMPHVGPAAPIEVVLREGLKWLYPHTAIGRANRAASTG